MKFYRRLLPFKAISFDLDDTLYHNKPVMLAAEQSMQRYFIDNVLALVPKVATNDKASLTFDRRFWLNFRQQALQGQGQLRHDVTALRLQTYFLGLSAVGFSPAQAIQQAQMAMHYFTKARSNFTVDDQVHQLLTQLSQQYPLAAISNGNVNTQDIGIKHYFSSLIHAGNGVKQKPHPGIFHLVSEQLKINPSELLHVGDCGRADVFGAMVAGCQAVWLPRYKVGKALTVLPQMEIDDVSELSCLLP